MDFLNDTCQDGLDICNATFLSTEEVLKKETVPPHLWFVGTVIGLIALVGIVGNGMLMVLISIKSSLHTTPNFYILNRSIANLMICLMIPLVTYVVVKNAFIFGSVACKLYIAVLHTVPLTSNFFLVFMCLDCYLASRKHIHSHSFRVKVLKITSGVTWGIGILLAVPIYIFSESLPVGINSNHVCLPPMYKGNNFVNYMTGFFIPIVFIWVYISLMYPPKNVQREELDQSSKQLRRLVVALAVSFSICETPMLLLQLYFEVGPIFESLMYVYPFLLSISYINIPLHAAICIFYKEDLKRSALFQHGNAQNQPGLLQPMVAM